MMCLYQLPFYLPTWLSLVVLNVKKTIQMATTELTFGKINHMICCNRYVAASASITSDLSKESAQTNLFRWIEEWLWKPKQTHSQAHSSPHLQTLPNLSIPVCNFTPVVWQARRLIIKHHRLSEALGRCKNIVCWFRIENQPDKTSRENKRL